jgi:hypothetical protein
MKCTPYNLRVEDPEEIAYLSYIFSKMSEKNPINMFM